MADETGKRGYLFRERKGGEGSWGSWGVAELGIMSLLVKAQDRPAEYEVEEIVSVESIAHLLSGDSDRSVVLPWVTKCSWKEQSILFSGLRGPDHALLTNVKQVSKWMRAVSQENADPSKPYMNNIQLPLASAMEKELEHSPCHFVHHFADALAVIAYNHPDQKVQRQAFAYHHYIAEELFHFLPESPDLFRWRHRDKPNGEDSEPTPPEDPIPEWILNRLGRETGDWDDADKAEAMA
jgi:hypothetical protein